MTYIKNKNIDLLPTVEIADVLNNNEVALNSLKAFSNFTGEVLPAMIGFTSAPSPTTLVSGRLWGVHFIVSKTTLVTGIKFNVYTAGVYTANNTNGMCLYSEVNGVLTKVTNGELTGDNFFTTQGINTVLFTSPISLTPGHYKILILWNASSTTTAPALWNWCNIINGNGIAAILGNSNQFSSTTSSQTSFSTTRDVSSLSSAAATIPMIWLY